MRVEMNDVDDVEWDQPGLMDRVEGMHQREMRRETCCLELAYSCLSDQKRGYVDEVCEHLLE